MGLNETPSSQRLHIGIFGRRNAGKSSIINAITGQNLAIVSDVKGTTTDPVQKAMELLPIGPIVMIDTPGFDDEGELGLARVEKSMQVLNKTDFAVLVVDGTQMSCTSCENGLNEQEQNFLLQLEERELPYIVAINKSERLSEEQVKTWKEQPFYKEHGIMVSALTGMYIHELKDYIAAKAEYEKLDRPIVGDLLNPGDVVVLVVPVDSAAPKGRLILPQQQTIRDLLDHGCMPLVVKETDLPKAFTSLKEDPKMVITDSQVFAKVAKETKRSIPMTSFSILFARYKGDLEAQVKGANAIGKLQDGDKVLISEGCTHHRQCGDIGSVKLPNWLTEHPGKKLEFEFSSGTEFPASLRDYKLVIHCGGCMLNDKEMKHRLAVAAKEGVPMTNYGVAIAYLKGILERTLEPFDK